MELKRRVGILKKERIKMNRAATESCKQNGKGYVRGTGYCKKAKRKGKEQTTGVYYIVMWREGIKRNVNLRDEAEFNRI